MSNSKAKHAFRYFSCRNISSPEDENAGRRVYAGKALASSLIDVPAHRPAGSRTEDSEAGIAPVHLAIRHSLEANVDDFGVLNAGMTLVARAAEVDDKNRTLLLDCPRLIDGEKTQSELRRYAELGGTTVADPHVRFEVVACSDDNLVDELAIARQLQHAHNPFVLNAERWKALEASLRTAYPGASLDGSGLRGADDRCWDVASISQVLLAFMPRRLFDQLGVGQSKAFAFSRRAQCFRLFERIHAEREQKLKEVYTYCMEIAGTAMKMYDQWRTHPELLRALGAGPSGSVVPDGVVFPVLAALAAFDIQTPQTWDYMPSQSFREGKFITTVAELYRDVADSKPFVFGKSSACYRVLEHVVSIYADV